MKKIKITMLLVMFVCALNAQDADYTGPAKTEVKSFWRQVEMQKNGKGTSSSLTNMEKALSNVKQKDPSYNTTAMESELNLIKEKVAQTNSVKVEGNQNKQKPENSSQSTDNNNGKPKSGFAQGDKNAKNKINADKLYSYLFSQSHTTGTPNSEKLLAALNEYNAKASELLAMDFEVRDRTNPRLKSVFDLLDAKATGSDNGKGGKVKEEVSEDENEMSGDASEERVKCFFYNKQLEQEKWDAARKLFPKEANYELMYQKKTAVLAKYGTIESLKSNIEKNNAEAIKNRRLPTAVTSDPALEKLAIETFNKYLSSEFNGTAYKAIMMQKDWGIIRAEITGVILGRKIQLAIVYKGTDGKCYLKTGIILKEDYIGGTFKNTSADDARFSGGELLCEFAK